MDEIDDIERIKGRANKLFAALERETGGRRRLPQQEEISLGNSESNGTSDRPREGVKGKPAAANNELDLILHNNYLMIDNHPKFGDVGVDMTKMTAQNSGDNIVEMELMKTDPQISSSFLDKVHKIQENKPTLDRIEGASMTQNDDGSTVLLAYKQLHMLIEEVNGKMLVTAADIFKLEEDSSLNIWQATLPMPSSPEPQLQASALETYGNKGNSTGPKF
ncbi:MAG: hypothetical protein OEY94_00010 [Alphaproteobacteria bacterium]|nr:hypothetical protein [Alphaproteobacteria bacterium]